MKRYTYGLVAAGALLAAGVMVTVPAEARPRASFSIQIGDVAIGYADGYYDQDRRWHRWHSTAERNWYRAQRRDSYFHMRRNSDRNRYRRDWWNGRRDDWRQGGNTYGNSGPDFAVVLGGVVFAYQDGYYDRERRWHNWGSDNERNWYSQNRRDAYFAMRRDDDRDENRRDWYQGRRDDWRVGGNNGPDFTVQLGGVVFAYEDGYYDRERRWHNWGSDNERNWYRQNRRDAYFQMRRDDDRDQYRRDWYQGRRDDWRVGGVNIGGPNFAISLGGVVFAYQDGYYDRERRWHTWGSDNERDWYRQNNTRTYYDVRRDRDDDRMRRDWREGRGNDWRRNDDDNNNGH